MAGSDYPKKNDVNRNTQPSQKDLHSARTVVSDNGSQFVSEEFETFLRDHGIAHRKVTPYWPQANAQVERFNKTIEKAIHGAYVEGKDWRKELYIFLLNYRATSHATTCVSPALLHLGREIRMKVPQVESPNGQCGG